MNKRLTVRETIMYLYSIKTDISLNKVDDKNNKFAALARSIDLLELFQQDIEIS